MWSLLATIGMVAIEASYVPQIYRLHRLKESRDLSLLFPGLNLIGRLCAISYSLHLGDHIFAIGFLVGIVLRSVFFAQVFVYRPSIESSHADRVEPELALVTEPGHG